jgi:hypothetical protein
MKVQPILGLPLLTAFLGAALTALAADPRIDSWLITDSGKYARIYTTTAEMTAGTPVNTWSRGAVNQSLPAYVGVQEIYSSADWVYIRSTGLGGHIMGPWYIDANKTQLFPNLPANTHTFYRIPRAPTVPVAKTLTGLGQIGVFVDGVAMFDSRDAFYWNGTSESQGSGNWNREAYVNERLSFDPAYAHQEQSGTYHYHANPIALRYRLGDHVDYNAVTKTYAESTAPVTRHSPILGWVRDGFPIYGPYGYSVATNSASAVRRMISGFQVRNGQRGTDNLPATGRLTIPAWAARFYGVPSGQAGPGVSVQYPLGRYMEDNAYLGDLGFNQVADFDLDEYNGRWCVTPEFPGGTYAYFVGIDATGAPAFPYNIGRAFHGEPTGNRVTGLTESVTTNFVGGADLAVQLRPPAVARDNGTLTLVWNSVDGGAYRVESSAALPAWTTQAPNIASQGTTTQFTTNANANANAGFLRVARLTLANYDPVSGSTTTGGGGITAISPVTGTRGTSVNATITLSQTANPAVPPQNAPINSLTIGTIAATAVSRPTQYTIQATFNIPAGAAAGLQSVTVVFPGPPGDPTATVTYTLANGFTIN